MTKSVHTVRVPLKERSYPIYIGGGLLGSAGSYFLKHNIGKSIVIITDSHVAPKYLPILQHSLERKKYSVRTIILPPGESQKSIASAEKIYTQLLRWNIERSSTIVALGGGVIGDLAGFVAATFQRGVGFVQIPTTLLAQVDSSVGGKVGINHPLAKNMIGAFYQPSFVLADTSVLKTLPKREIICGLGEVIKYGIILDKKFFDSTERSLDKVLSGDRKELTQIVKRSCELKAYVVAKDEKESNLRAILNFGHTIGHALEHAGGYGTLKHGEAVLYGMVAESFIASQKHMIPSDDIERMEQLIRRIPIPSLTPLKLKYPSLRSAMMMDKKVKDGSIRMTLPKKIGSVTLPMVIDEDAIRHAVEYVKVYGT
ncbi:MAG: 3-dehydroquinate synthase [Bacteroidota bacterium]